jgi:hypothetical protein
MSLTEILLWSILGFALWLIAGCVVIAFLRMTSSDNDDDDQGKPGSGVNGDGDSDSRQHQDNDDRPFHFS